MQYIPIEKELIPYRFEVLIEEETFTFEVHYNAEYDYFTVDLSRGDEALVYGAKLVYGSPLFAAYADRRFPKVAIIPYDLSEKENRVTYENFGKTVFLYLFGKEDLLEDDLQQTD